MQIVRYIVDNGGKKQTTKIKVWEVSEREMEIGQQNPITKPVNVRVAKLKVQMKV